MVREITFPKLGRLYGRAAWGAARSALTSNGSLKGLAVEPLRSHHPGISQEQVEAYRQLFSGDAYDGVYRRTVPSVLVHITSFPVQMALMSATDFPLPVVGMVHLRNKVDHHRPVHPDQALDVEVHAENFRPHRRGTQVDIVARVFSHADAEDAPAGTLLWTGVSTYLRRGSFIAGTVDDSPEEAPREAFDPPVKTGMWTLGADAGRQYAAVSGDYNPIHISRISAKMLGMPAAIVHGMYCAGRVLEGREPDAAGHSWSVNFYAPVTLPGRVAVSVNPIDDYDTVAVGWHPKKQRQHFTMEISAGK